MPNVGEFCYLEMWINKTMSMSFDTRSMCGSMLVAWRQALPVAMEHVVRDMPCYCWCAYLPCLGPYIPDNFGILICCSFHVAASPSYCLSCCPFASMRWVALLQTMTCVAPYYGFRACPPRLEACPSVCTPEAPKVLVSDSDFKILIFGPNARQNVQKTPACTVRTTVDEPTSTTIQDAILA
jgi:hypothetical protein